jgi:hypothetical protein
MLNSVCLLVQLYRFFIKNGGLEEFHHFKIWSEKLKLMMRRVECVVDPELDKTFSKQWVQPLRSLPKMARDISQKLNIAKAILKTLFPGMN